MKFSIFNFSRQSGIPYSGAGQFSKKARGFTLVELILYMAIVALVLGSLIPFAWNVVGNSERSMTQQEVYSNARYISERIKYEIRNSLGINSISSTQIVLCKTAGSCATNPTTITFSSPNVTIQNQGAAVVNLNSADVTISSPTFFTDYSSGALSKNAQFAFTVSSNFSQVRKEYQLSVNVEGNGEVRSL